MENTKQLKINLGHAIFKNDICEIAKYNNIIRENNIIFKKMEILECIYWSSCNEVYEKNKSDSTLCEFEEFESNNETVYKFIEKYWSIFN